MCSTCWLDELKYVFNYGVLRRHPKVRLILVVVVVIIIIFIYLIYLLCCNFWEDLSCIRLKFIAFVSSLMVLYKCGCASAVCVQQACSRDIIYSQCPDVPWQCVAHMACSCLDVSPVPTNHHTIAASSILYNWEVHIWLGKYILAGKSIKLQRHLINLHSLKLCIYYCYYYYYYYYY